MMRYLGIDYGEKRIGIAVSDPAGKIAFPKKIILRTPSIFKELKKLIKEEEIAKIVVGLPFGPAGADTGQTLKIREFAQNLHREIMLPVEFENELLTTKLAEGNKNKKKYADASAAALILQSYLDKQKLKDSG